MKDKASAETQERSTYKPPSASLVRGALGCFLGAILSFVLLFLALTILARLFPDGDPGGWLSILGTFVLLIPAGAIGGALLAVQAPAILRLLKRR
jgi:hypothetical protein